MGFHVYKDGRTSSKGEMLTTVLKSTNIEDRFAGAVLKGNRLVGHLPLERTGRFAKTNYLFLNASI